MHFGDYDIHMHFVYIVSKEKVESTEVCFC